MTFLSIKFSQPVRTIVQREEKPQFELVSLKNDALRDIFLDKCRVDEAPVHFSKRQRVAFTINTTLSIEAALSIDDSDIDYRFFKTHCVKWANLKASGVSIATLNKIGFDTLNQLTERGMKTVDTVSSPRLAKDLARVYGVEACRMAFLRTPSDAVLIAGSESMTAFDISANALFVQCNGCLTEALSVFAQLDRLVAIRGVRAQTLIDCGVTRNHLMSMGYNAATLSANVTGPNEDVARLVPSLM